MEHSKQPRGTLITLAKLFSISYFFSSLAVDLNVRKYMQKRLIDNLYIGYKIVGYLITLFLFLYSLLGKSTFIAVVGYFVLLCISPLLMYVILFFVLSIGALVNPIVYFPLLLSFAYYNIYSTATEIDADLYSISRLGKRGLEGAYKFFNMRPSKLAIIKILGLPFFTHPPMELRVWYMTKHYMKIRYKFQEIVA